MMNTTNFNCRNLLLVLLTALLFSCKSKENSIEDFKPDVILTWNKEIMKLAVDKDGLLTLNGVRTEALKVK